MYKAILFDAYGTLLSTGTGSVEAAGKLLRALGVCVDAKAFYGRWKQVHRAHILALDAFMPESEIFVRDLAALQREYGIAGNPAKDVRPMLDSMTGRRAFPEAKEALESLSEGYALYIASTSDTEPLLENLRANGLAVNGVYTSESLGVYKPQRRFYERILERTGLSPEEAVFVGDSLEDDVRGPQQLGIFAVWLNRTGEENHAGIRPDAVISNLLELKDCIQP